MVVINEPNFLKSDHEFIAALWNLFVCRVFKESADPEVLRESKEKWSVECLDLHCIGFHRPTVIKHNLEGGNSSVSVRMLSARNTAT